MDDKVLAFQEFLGLDEDEAGDREFLWAERRFHDFLYFSVK